MVLAAGVNSRPPLAPHLGYHPPQTAVMVQDLVLRLPTWPADQVIVFFKQPVDLIFDALIPKGSYLNISLLWREFTKDSRDDFIDAQRWLDLANNTHTSGCSGGCSQGINNSAIFFGYLCALHG